MCVCPSVWSCLHCPLCKAHDTLGYHRHVAYAKCLAYPLVSKNMSLILVAYSRIWLTPAAHIYPHSTGCAGIVQNTVQHGPQFISDRQRGERLLLQMRTWDYICKLCSVMAHTLPRISGEGLKTFKTVSSRALCRTCLSEVNMFENLSLTPFSKYSSKPLNSSA